MLRQLTEEDIAAAELALPPGADDGELVRLAELLRSDPPLRGGQHIQSWPILSVQRRDDDSVDVLLREEYWKGQVIKLRQNGQDWMIVIVGAWAA